MRKIWKNLTTARKVMKKSQIIGKRAKMNKIQENDQFLVFCLVKYLKLSTNVKNNEIRSINEEKCRNA
jgi:hypothetical protein